MKQPKLLDQVRDAIRTRHYSIRTEEAYLQWIRRYIFFHNKQHPRAMGEQEISDFLTWLAWKSMSQPRPKIKPCLHSCFFIKRY